jgi:hypothetical protein
VQEGILATQQIGAILRRAAQLVKTKAIDPDIGQLNHKLWKSTVGGLIGFRYDENFVFRCGSGAAAPEPY